MVLVKLFGQDKWLDIFIMVGNIFHRNHPFYIQSPGDAGNHVTTCTLHKQRNDIKIENLIKYKYHIEQKSTLNRKPQIY